VTTTLRAHVITFLTVAIVATARLAAAQPTESVWEASSGLTPDQVCPAWTLTDSAAAADPVLAAGVLTLSTATNTEDMFYTQAIPLPAPDPIVIEARVQLVSGSSSSDNRGPIAIGVTTSSSTGAFLFVGTDEMFLTGDGDVRGASAVVDTDAAPHTYRIEITAAGAVSVSYDGTPTLSGTTFTSASAFGPDPRVLWGEGSVLTFGTEAWTSFRHNAALCESGTTTTVTTTSTTTTDTEVTTTSSTTSSTLGVPTTTTTVLPPTTSTSTTTLPPTTSSTTSTTSTSSPSASSSTSSTTSRPIATTTSTTLPGGCDDVTPGSLAALRCRLDVLAARIQSAPGLGGFRSKLAQNADRAVALAGEADAACTDGDHKTASRRLKQIPKQLQKMTHRLHGLAARKQLDAGLRAELITVIESIRQDAAALRKNPCP
jgi:hypothetical protein